LNSSFSAYSHACRDENNTIYVTSGVTGTVYSISTSGVVTTIASNTSDYFPSGIAYYDGSVYVVDSETSRIRKVVISNGVVTTFAGGYYQYGFVDNVTGTNARFASPQGITVDSQGNLYVVDPGNRRIRKITTAAVVSTVAGNGTQAYADGVGGTFNTPTQILSTSTGDLWVVDTNSSNVRVIRYVTVSTGEIRTLDTSGALATNPSTPYDASMLYGLAIDPADALYINNGTTITKRQGNTFFNISLNATDFRGIIVTSQYALVTFNNGTNILRFSPGTLSAVTASVSSLNAGPTTISTLTATRISAANATIASNLSAASANIMDVSLTNINGLKYFAGGARGRTFQLNYSSGTGFTVTTFKTGFNANQFGLAIDSAGIVYASDNYRIQKITSDGTTTLLAGSPTVGGTTDGNGSAARFNIIRAMTIDSSGNLYALDGLNGERLRKITSSGEVTTITTGLLSFSEAITVDSSGNLYTVNYNANSIQRTTPGGTITTFAGGNGSGNGNGVGTQIQFNFPTGIVIDSVGNLYVADLNNHRIRKVTSSGVASVFAGSGTPGNTDGIGVLATFNSPYKITIDSTSTNLFVFDNYSVRRIVIATGQVTTLAGSGTVGSSNGVGASASFGSTYSIAAAPSGELYVSSSSGIRKLTSKIDATYASTTLTGGSLSTEFDPRTGLATITVPGGTTNAKVVSFSLPARYPSMSSITGEWILGLYATVGVPASPASFYFEIMDGSTVVVTGNTRPTSVNLSSPLQLYTASLFVPARTYSSSVILNLYVTTQASSSLTLEFSGSTTSSYLSTTIQPYNDILTANEYRFKSSSGILLNSNGLSAITANPTPILQVDGSASIIGNLTVGGTANITGVTTVSNDATIMSNLSVSTTIRNATGTNSAPTYTFTGDLTTGMFRPAASNVAWSTNGTERMRIDQTGQVMIAKTTASYPLDVNGTTRATDFIATSDRRVKTDIQTISNALDIVKGLRGVYFTRTGETQRQVGVIAQEVEEVLPEVVHTSLDDLKSVSYGNIVGVLIEALKDVSKRLEKMENK
jgi:hypothetical protein